MLAALDIDLRRIHCRTEDGRDICTNVTFEKAAPLLVALSSEQPTVLIECGSPHMYGAPMILKKKIAWLIYNSAIVERLHYLFESVLVSPSSAWTLGYQVKARHKLCGATARNKDLRECEAMMWFYKKAPEKWVEWDKYLASL